MDVVPPSTAPATVLLTDGSLPVRTQPFRPSPARPRPVERIFAEAIVLCMKEARRPASLEVQAVAARIWNDMQAGPRKTSWDEILPGCGRHRQILAAARVALGQGTDGRPP